jgi:hypothetical protein
LRSRASTKEEGARMDWAYKAVLTATTVALLLAVAQLFGRRLAGILAGLPTVTGPALVWLALDHGTEFAVQAALGSVAASALCGLFAVGYERASRRRGPLAAVLVAGLASAAPMPLLAAVHLDASPLLLLLGVVAVCTLCVTWIPATSASRDVAAPPARRRALELWLTAAVSGLVSGVTALAAPEVGPFWAGVLASPPLIAAAVAVHLHAAARTEGAVARFLRGYAAGLIGRSGFAALFAALLAPTGVVAAAVVATVIGCMATLATAQVLRTLERRAPPDIAAVTQRAEP